MVSEAARVRRSSEVLASRWSTLIAPDSTASRVASLGSFGGLLLPPPGGATACRVALLTELHWLALEVLSSSAGRPVQGLQQGGRAAGCTSRMQHRQGGSGSPQPGTKSNSGQHQEDRRGQPFDLANASRVRFLTTEAVNPARIDKTRAVPSTVRASRRAATARRACMGIAS